MANLVKFNRIVAWNRDGRPTKYGPVYIDIDKIQYICPHADGDPKHCTVTLYDKCTVGLAVDMDHLASMVNKEVTGTQANFTEELIQEIGDDIIRAVERRTRLERQVDNGRC